MHMFWPAGWKNSKEKNHLPSEHKGALAITKLKYLKYELLEHPPFRYIWSFWLPYTPNPKEIWAGKLFETNEEATAVVDEYFADLSDSYFKDGICLLEKRWTNFIELKEDYIEK